MKDDGIRSPGQPGDSAKPLPMRRPRLLAARLALVKLALVWYLVVRPPSLRAGGQSSRPQSATGAEGKESAVKGNAAKRHGRRSGTRSYHGRRRLAHSLVRVCAASTAILFLLMVLAAMAWHPGGWPPL